MPHAHGGVLVLLVALGLGVVLGNLLVALVSVVLTRARLEGLAPRELSRVAFVGLFTPALLGVLASVAVLLVPGLTLLYPGLDHCTVVMDSPHICFIHGTIEFRSPLEAVGVALLLLLLVASMGAEFARLWRWRRELALLLEADSAEAVTWNDDEDPYAFTVGLLQPRIIISTGLRHVLSPAQLKAAVAHERSHVTHRDTLVRALARVSSFLLVSTLRKRFAALLVLGQEKRADADAALVVGSEALVAETLLAMVRAAPRGRRPFAGAALAEGALTARVEALCRAPATGCATRKLAIAFVLVTCTTLGMQAVVHQASERVAGVLLSSPVHTHANAASTSHFTHP